MYPGVKKKDWEKIDRCRTQIRGTNKRTGKSYTEDEKIAICVSAVQKNAFSDLTLSYFEREPLFFEGNIAKDVAIFRTGFWKGKEYDEAFVKKIIDQTELAQEMGILDEDLPISKAHPSLFGGGGGVDDVIGYMRGPYYDKKTGRLRVKEWEITDDEAFKKINSGTWRYRSAELYRFEIGEELEISPVLGGCAYVRLPAVGGLNLAASFINEEEVIEEMTDEVGEEWVKIQDITDEEIAHYAGELDKITGVSFRKLTGAEKNDLSDPAFAYIESGGKKDEGGKTVPRSKRHFPHHNQSVKSGSENSSVDKPHLRNALARIGQGAAFGAQAKPHLIAHAKALGIGDYRKEGIMNLEMDGTTYEVDETLGKIITAKLDELNTLKEMDNKKEALKLVRELDGKKVFFGSKEALDIYDKAVKSCETYEKEKKEKEEASRLENIDKLAAEGKVVPNEVENMKEFVKGLSNEQWSSFSKTLENTPPIVKPGEQHGKDTKGAPGSPKEMLRHVEEAIKFYKETDGSPKQIAVFEKKLENLKKELEKGG